MSCIITTLSNRTACTRNATVRASSTSSRTSRRHQNGPHVGVPAPPPLKERMMKMTRMMTMNNMHVRTFSALQDITNITSALGAGSRAGSGSSSSHQALKNKAILGLTASALATASVACLISEAENNARHTHTTHCSAIASISAGEHLKYLFMEQESRLKTRISSGSTAAAAAAITAVTTAVTTAATTTSTQAQVQVTYNENNNSSAAATASPTSSISSLVEASVNQATAWEKKAKAAVGILRTPSRYDTSVRAIRGGRLSMEDAYCIHDGGRFTGVFDGHGGAGVSNFISENMYSKIQKYLEQNRTSSSDSSSSSSSSSYPSLASIVRSMGAAFDELDDEVLGVDDFQYQGSTAVAVYVHEDSKTRERTVISANVGDSRAILSRGPAAINLTRDHKPDDEIEKKRILAMGETIEWDEYCQVSRVKSLSLSRAIGDRFAKPVVSGEVEIQLFPLDDLVEGEEKDDFILLASDGLWDVMTSQDCVDFVRDRLNPTSAQARNMSESDIRRYKITRRKNMSRIVTNEASRRGSYDNISVVVVWLNEPLE